jgi:hypothetical protein
VEFPLGDFSPIVPLKYYKYLSEDRRVRGDVGRFRIPIDMALTLRNWGIDEGTVYIRVWAKA